MIFGAETSVLTCGPSIAIITRVMFTFGTDLNVWLCARGVALATVPVTWHIENLWRFLRYKEVSWIRRGVLEKVSMLSGNLEEELF